MIIWVNTHNEFNLKIIIFENGDNCVAFLHFLKQFFLIVCVFVSHFELNHHIVMNLSFKINSTILNWDVNDLIIYLIDWFVLIFVLNLVLIHSFAALELEWWALNLFILGDYCLFFLIFIGFNLLINLRVWKVINSVLVRWLFKLNDVFISFALIILNLILKINFKEFLKINLGGRMLN